MSLTIGVPFSSATPSLSLCCSCSLSATPSVSSARPFSLSPPSAAFIDLAGGDDGGDAAWVASESIDEVAERAMAISSQEETLAV